MESLTGLNTDNVPEKSAKTQTQNKVSIGKNEFEKLGIWLCQLEEISKGYLNLTRSDLVNFLIRDHKAELSPKEMQQIRHHHYDPIRHLNWITPRLKEALASCDIDRVNAIQEEIRGIELSVINKAKEFSAPPFAKGTEQISKPRRRKSKPAGSQDAMELASTNNIEAIMPKT